MRIVSVAEMRSLERQTFAAGVSEDELQDRAGRAVARAVADLRAPGEAVAFVGPGNNGRDASIALRNLLDVGWTGALYLSSQHSIRDSEIRAFAAAGGRIIWHPEGQATLAVDTALERATVAIDGLLGIGARGEPRPPLAEIIAALNANRAGRGGLTVVAVDTPSGVDADTGRAAEAAVVADMTVVLGGAKRGLLNPDALEYTGRVIFADIGVAEGPTGAPELVTRASVAGLLAPRHPTAHKGSLGKLLVVAGSRQYVGAAYLVCAAAARAGVGLVTLAAPLWLRDVVAARLPEITYLPLPEGGPAGAAHDCALAVAEALPAYQALAVGPGLSMDGAVGAFVEAVLTERAHRGTPTVVDADGLNALADRPAWPSWIGEGVVLTPHAGELRRLAPMEEAGEPWERARELVQGWPVTLVIKGAVTAIACGDQTWVHARPNPSLATAGTGDVLTGLISALLARGVGPAEAARLGVWVHGEAGARAAGGALRGLLASDLLSEIPAVLAEAAIAVSSQPPAS